MQTKLKQVLPSPLWEAARGLRDGFGIALQLPAATFHPWRADSIRRLEYYKDIHKGERCFIIGNGPSLKKTDLTLLRDEFTFGMNRIYLLFPELGFTTSYYLSVNNLVIEQCADEIRTLTIPKFISWRARSFFPPTEDTMYLFTTYTGPKFARDVRGRLWEGATVTYTALQLAFHMGFSEVILIGVDHNFTTKGQPNTTVVSDGDDPNHFHSAYFGKGFRWQLPDLETSERAYHLAKEVYNLSGRQVFDATVGGKLTVFPKVNFEDLF
ncbi:MAG: 6-hydroxymethylpterin diphosphokinase MptE-like protein [Anaerolineales bacterium]